MRTVRLVPSTALAYQILTPSCQRAGPVVLRVQVGEVAVQKTTKLFTFSTGGGRTTVLDGGDVGITGGSITPAVDPVPNHNQERVGISEISVPRHERRTAQRYRSYRRRQAPTTNGQKQKLRELWPAFGLEVDFALRWDFREIFGYPELSEQGCSVFTAVTLDIGFGSGDSLLGMAAARPEDCFVGMEVHKPGIAIALAGLKEKGLSNVKIVTGDALTALMDHIEDRTLDRCCIFFPDPFPRNPERRLVRPFLLSLLSKKLRMGGKVHVATDVEEYGEHVVKTFGASLSTAETGLGLDSRDTGPLDNTVRSKEASVGVEEGFRSLDGGMLCWEGGEETSRPIWRPLTKYEEKAIEAGRRVRDFSFRLKTR